MEAEKTDLDKIEVGPPTNCVHTFSITVNKDTGKLEGVPTTVKDAIISSGLTEEEVLQNPQKALDILYKLNYFDVFSKESVKSISAPTNSNHMLSITFNKSTGKFEGIPEGILKIIESKGLTVEQIVANPSIAQDLLYTIDLSEALKDVQPILDVSSPTDTCHPFSIKMNKETGKLEGVPDAVVKALQEAGLTEEQVLAKPELAVDVLYKLNYWDVVRSNISVGAPTKITHNVAIRFNKDTGKFEGIPDEVRAAIQKAGLTEEEIMKEPSKVKDILYQIKLSDVFSDPVFQIEQISEPSDFKHTAGIRFNKETGEVEGVPTEIREALAKSGLTVEDILKNPDKVDVASLQEILYKIKESDIKK